ncbi:MAG: enoyl-CoA hydratase/isomerase family protein [Candidatus Hydrogenedentes bacterium]|nr:enoyl-CoA hydratase/isomerase family protein [Candidatus Hydrogenedentota bacterium]
MIKTEQVENILIARLDNPPKNLMNATMVGQLSELLDRVDADDAVRVLILTGNMDGVFIQHYDVAELVQTCEYAREDPGIGKGGELHDTHKCFLKIESIATPVIAAINGTAHGGGYELALACDFRLLSEDGSVGLPEAGLGILPGAGGTQRLARLIGVARAKYLMMRGQVVDAKTALDYGMVHQLAAPRNLLDEAMTLARELAALPQAAVGLIKQSVNEGAQLPMPEALRQEEDKFWDLMRTDEAYALMKGYVEAGQNGLE